jgi:phosphoribosyl-ATP pyrophosphohydrolase/phosphoribosyl-AMP cyclohydrolase
MILAPQPGTTMPHLPLKFDSQGLLPAIVQDHLTGEIRMFAFATETAVRTTLETGRATFWSRSRGELWQKGRVGGHEIPVVRVLADCDADCLIYASDPQGPSCHSGAPSCFFQTLEGATLSQASEPPQTLLASLESSMRSSQAASSEAGGRGAASAAIGVKLRDEASELASALERGSDERVVAEAADTLQELIAGLGSRSIALRRVLVELARRSAHDDGT